MLKIDEPLCDRWSQSIAVRPFPSRRAPRLWFHGSKGRPGQAKFLPGNIAARKLVEIANGVEAMQDGRIYIERVNARSLAAGGIGEDFRTGMARAIALGWLWRHESGTYVRFTDSGAALFA